MSIKHLALLILSITLIAYLNAAKNYPKTVIYVAQDDVTSVGWFPKELTLNQVIDKIAQENRISPGALTTKNLPLDVPIGQFSGDHVGTINLISTDPHFKFSLRDRKLVPIISEEEEKSRTTSAPATENSIALIDEFDSKREFPFTATTTPEDIIKGIEDKYLVIPGSLKLGDFRIVGEPLRIIAQRNPGGAAIVSKDPSRRFSFDGGLVPIRIKLTFIDELGEKKEFYFGPNKTLREAVNEIADQEKIPGSLKLFNSRLNSEETVGYASIVYPNGIEIVSKDRSNPFSFAHKLLEPKEKLVSTKREEEKSQIASPPVAPEVPENSIALIDEFGARREFPFKAGETLQDVIKGVENNNVGFPESLKLADPRIRITDPLSLIALQNPEGIMIASRNPSRRFSFDGGLQRVLVKLAFIDELGEKKDFYLVPTKTLAEVVSEIEDQHKIPGTLMLFGPKSMLETVNYAADKYREGIRLESKDKSKQFSFAHGLIPAKERMAPPLSVREIQRSSMSAEAIRAELLNIFYFVSKLGSVV